MFACLYCTLPQFFFFLYFFLSDLLPYLSFPLRIHPFRFQAGCHKGWLNLGLVFFVFILCCNTFVLIGGCVLAWLSVWSEMQTCIWPSWCHCHSLYLASVKSMIGFTFLVPAHLGNPGKRAVKRVWVWVWVWWMRAFVVCGLVLFPNQAKRLAWGNVSEMTYFVSSGT